MANGGNAKVHPEDRPEDEAAENNSNMDTAVVDVHAPDGVRVKSEGSSGNGSGHEKLRRNSTTSTQSLASINVGGKPVTWTRVGTAVGIGVVMLMLVVGIVVVYVTKDPSTDEPVDIETEETTGTGPASACFAAGTLLETRDGTLRRIEDIQIGDHLALGGRVTARMEFEAKRAQFFRYEVDVADRQAGASRATPQRIIVAGSHAVLERDGVWRRVYEAVNSTPIDDATWQSLAPTGGIDRARVFDLDTQRHRLLVRPTLGSPGTVFSDFSEVDADHPLVQHFERALIADLMATAERDLRALEV